MVPRFVPPVAAAAFVSWALLLPWLDAMDLLLVAPPVDPESGPGWVLRWVAILTAPVVLYVGWVLVSVFLWRRGLRMLATAIDVAVAMAAFGHVAIKAAIQRPRPPSLFDDTITYSSHSFPSGHMTAISVSAVLICLIVWDLRLRLRWLWGAAGAVLLVAINRWAINAHWVSDILGGLLLGGTAATLAIVLINPERLGLTQDEASQAEGTVALVYHPKRLPHWLARRLVPGALIFPTTPEELGDVQAKAAIEAGATLVLVAGGDGTVRQAASVLVGTNTRLGVLPAGTGNVLAYNLKIPKDIAAATRLALSGTPRGIDVLTVTFDTRSEICLVMAGAGLDARALADSPDALKRLLGTGAYAVGGLRQLGSSPFGVGDSEAFLVLIGNVASLGPGLMIFPDARPDDQQVDVLVAAPKDPAAVVGSVLRVLANRPHHESITVGQSESYEVRFDRPVPCEVDGDVVGEASVLTARPTGILQVMGS